MDNEKLMKMPTPSIDSVKVAVRVRPFSQVSDGCYAALLKISLTDFTTFLTIVIKLVFKLLIIYGILNLFK